MPGLQAAPEKTSSGIDGDVAPFTVSDAVNAEYYIGVNLESAVAVFGDRRNLFITPVAYSPEGASGVYLTRKGDLAAGAMDFALHLVTFDQADSEHPFQTRELVRLSSSSDRPAISQVRWLSNTDIGFVGEQPGGEPQVMMVDLNGRIRVLTDIPGKKLGFDTNGRGAAVVGVISPPDGEDFIAQHESFFVGDKTLRRVMGVDTIEWRRPNQYYVSDKGKAARPLAGVSNATSNSPPFVSVSPSGRYAAVTTSPPVVSEDWVGLPLIIKPVAGDPVQSYHAELTLVDLKDGKHYALSGAQMSFPYNAFQIVWDEANDRLFVFDQFLSSERLAQLTELKDRQQPVSFEYSLKTKRPAALIDSGPVREKFRDSAIEIECVRYDSEKQTLFIKRGASFQLYARTDNGWAKAASNENAGCQLDRTFDLFVDQYVDRPAQLFAKLPDGEPVAIGEINTDLKGRFNPSVYYEWTDKNGLAWHGGLTLPKGSGPDKRLPLIIQSHSFNPHNHVIEGAIGTSPGFSAQALASAGFAVFVMGSPKRDADGNDLYDDKKEFEVFTEGYRSLIEELTRQNTIDPDRVGIMAWSRSGFWLQHALAFGGDLFAAATAADASSFGQFYYLYFHNWPGGFQNDYLTQSGGATPFGSGLDIWRQRDPVALAAPFSIPILMQQYGKGLPSWWEPYVAMKEANEPAEYLIMPNTPHDPVKVKERYLVQSLSVDWFRFWLQGYEDPVREKEDQYARWREMRDKRCAWDEPQNEKPAYCDYSSTKH